MGNYGIKINVVTFIFMLLFFAGEIAKFHKKNQRNGSYQLL